MRPLLRDLFLRKRRDVTNSAVLPRFSRPCPNPRRRAGGSTSDQSVIPAAAAPAAPAIPIAIDVSAATANSDRSSAMSRRSKTIATVQAPAGTSLRTTCKGSPNQVPFKKFLISCAAGRPPAYRALSSAFCNLSSTGGCGAGLDESPIGSTFMPESSLTFEFSILLPIQHSTRSVRCRCRRLAQPATLRSPKLETYMCLNVHSLCTTVDSCGRHEAAIGRPRSCVRTLSDSRMQYILHLKTPTPDVYCVK